MWRQFSRNSAGSLVATIATALSTFALSVLLSRTLGADSYGKYAYAIFLVTTLSIFLGFGLPQALNRFVAEALGEGDSRLAGRFVRHSLVAILAINAGVGLLGLLTWRAIGRVSGLGDSAGLLLAVWLILIPTVIIAAQRATFASLMRLDLFAAIVAVPLFLRLALYYVLVRRGVSVTRLLFAEGIVQTVILAMLGLVLYRQLRRLPSTPAQTATPWRSRFVRYAGALAVVAILDYIVWTRSELLFIERMRSSSDVAFYTVATTIPGLTTSLLPAAITGSVIPLIARLLGARKHQEIRKLFLAVERLAAMTIVPIAIGGCLLSSQIISVIYGPAYQPAVPPMQIAFLASVTVSMLGIASAVLYGLGAPSFAIKLGLSLAPVSVVLNLVLIGKFGITGAAIANALTQMCAIPLTVREVTTRVGTRWPLASDGRILTAVGAMALAVLGVRQLPLPPIVTLAAGIIAGGLVYGVMLIAVRAVTPAEVALAIHHGKRLLGHADARLGTRRAPALILAGAAAFTVVMGLASGTGLGLKIFAPFVVLGGALAIVASPTASMLAVLSAIFAYPHMLVWLSVLSMGLAGTVLATLRAHRPLFQGFSPALAGSTGLALVGTLSLPFTENMYQSMLRLTTIWLSVIVVWMVGQNITTVTGMRRAALIIGASAAINGLLGLAKYRQTMYEGGVHRLSGVEGDPNYLALLLGMAVLVLPLALHGASVAKRLTIGAIGATVLALMVMTVSRGALLAFALTGVVFFLTCKSTKLRILLVVCSSIGMLLFFRSAFEQRATVRQERGEGNGRTAVWHDAVAVWTDHPLIGVGVGNYVDVAEHQLDRPANVTHNVMLQSLTDLGVAGLVIFCLTIGTIFVRTLRATVNARAPVERDTIWLLLAVTFGIIAAQFLDPLYSTTFWAILALADRWLALVQDQAAPLPKRAAATARALLPSQRPRLSLPAIRQERRPT